MLLTNPLLLTDALLEVQDLVLSRNYFVGALVC